jgi:hypothetical protein
METVPLTPQRIRDGSLAEEVDKQRARILRTKIEACVFRQRVYEGLLATHGNHWSTAILDTSSVAGWGYTDERLTALLRQHTNLDAYMNSLLDPTVYEWSLVQRYWVEAVVLYIKERVTGPPPRDYVAELKSWCMECAQKW